MSIHRRIEDIDAKLELIEHYVSISTLSKQQLALLYGTAEKLQLDEIDGMVFNADNIDTEMLAALKSQRKALTKRANRALDALEGLATSEGESEAEARGRTSPLMTLLFPTVTSLTFAGGMALHTNNLGRKVAIMALGASTGPVLDLPKTHVDIDADLERVFEMAQQKAVHAGYLSESTQACTCSLLPLPVRAFYELGDGKGLHFEHAHHVLAYSLLDYRDDKENWKVFVTKTSPETLSLSLVLFSRHDGVQTLQAADIHCRHALMTSGDADWERVFLALATYSWENVEQPQEDTVSEVWLDEGEDERGVAEKKTKSKRLRDACRHRFPSSRVSAMDHSEESVRATARLLATQAKFKFMGMNKRSLSPVTTEVGNILSETLDRIASTSARGVRDKDVSRCIIGLVATTGDAEVAGGQTLMPFIFPSTVLGTVVEKDITLSPLVCTAISFRLVMGLRPGASVLAIEDVGRTNTLYVHLPAHVQENVPRACRVRISYTTRREIIVRVALPHDFADWSNEVSIIHDSADAHLYFGDVPPRETTEKSVEAAIACPESGMIYKTAADSRVTAQQDLHVAHGLYSLALAYEPRNAKIWSNRSACAMHLKKGEFALMDAINASKCDPSWSKGFVRIGDACCLLLRFDDAVSNYKKALEVDPKNIGINEKLVTVLEKREALEAAAAQKREQTAARARENAVANSAHEKKDSNCACM